MKGFSIFALVLGLVLMAQPALAAEAAGFVAAVRAPAHLERDGAQVQVRIGSEIRVGDVLATGPMGRLKVLLSDDSVVSLGGDSRVELAAHRFAPAASQRSTRLRVTGGLVRALVQKVVSDTRADFQVTTRTAVAGVRGTEFAVRAEDESGRARLVTFSGAVDWSTVGGEPVRVAAGQGAGLADGHTTPVEAVAAAELEALRDATDAVQAPTALAWNLSPRDRIRPGRAAKATGDDLELDPAERQSDMKDLGPPQELEFTGGRTEDDREGQDGVWNNGYGGVGAGPGSGQGRYEGEGVVTPDANEPSELLTGDWSSSFADEPGFSGIPIRMDVTIVRN